MRGFALVTAARKVDFPAFGTPTKAISATILRVSLRRHRSPPSGPKRVAPLFFCFRTAVPSPPLPPLATIKVGFSYETVPTSSQTDSPFSLLVVVVSPSSLLSLPLETVSASSLSSCSTACVTSTLTTVPGGTRTSQSSPIRPLSYILPPAVPSSARKLSSRSRATKFISSPSSSSLLLSPFFFTTCPIRLLLAAAPPPPKALGRRARRLSPARVLRLGSSLRIILPPVPPLPPSGRPLEPFLAHL
mmetsp:Transcript_13143/g.23844  ORF Transcript_13143/g.23844 Transcript_13143/m.23844 type:complete len:246 (+) Transcript_13143:696-1433(+)